MDLNAESGAAFAELLPELLDLPVPGLSVQTPGEPSGDGVPVEEVRAGRGRGNVRARRGRGRGQVGSLVTTLEDRVQEWMDHIMKFVKQAKTISLQLRAINNQSQLNTDITQTSDELEVVYAKFNETLASNCQDKDFIKTQMIEAERLCSSINPNIQTATAVLRGKKKGGKAKSAAPSSAGWDDEMDGELCE